MKSLSIVLVFLLVLVGEALALAQQEIRDLAVQPHSDAELAEKLKIFPTARRYEVSARVSRPGHPWNELPKIVVDQKAVRGEYIVQIYKLPGVDAEFINMIRYDAEARVYRKTLLQPDGHVHEWIGLANPDTRTLAWSSNAPDGESRYLGLETYTDEGGTWQETNIQGEKILHVIDGNRQPAE